MGPTEINGLPAHVLLVHVVLALVPLAAIMVVAAAVWPAARRRLGIATPVVALLALVSVPLTTHAGEWLEKRVDPDPLVDRHAELGDQLLPWVAGLFLVAAAGWILARVAAPATTGTGPTPSEAEPGPGRGARGWAGPAMVVVAVLSVAVAAGSVVQLYRIGDSGAKAVWHDGFSPTPRPHAG